MSRQKLILLVVDFFTINLAFFLAYWLRFESGLFRLPLPVPQFVIYGGLIIWVYWLVIFTFRGHYRIQHAVSRFDVFVNVLKTTFIGVLILFLLTTDISHPITRSRSIIASYWLLMVFWVSLGRITFYTVQRNLFNRGIGLRRAVIVGCNDRGKDLYKRLKRYPALGFEMVGFVDKKNPAENGPLFLGKIKNLASIIDNYRINEVLIALDSKDHREIIRVISSCNSPNISLKIIPDLYDIISGQARTNQIYGLPLIEIFPDFMPPWEQAAKRAIDIVFSLFILIITLPISMIVAIAVKADSRGPIFYRQKRVGKGGKEFIINKFRSMVHRAEDRTGAVWAGKDDSRITRVGRVIRSLRVDEIPQFINVLDGDMSLVGPRPERSVFVKKLRKKIPLYERRLNVRPGITGWAQVKHKYDESLDDVRVKLRYDFFYLENMSLRMDFKILLNTIWVIISRKGH